MIRSLLLSMTIFLVASRFGTITVARDNPAAPDNASIVAEAQKKVVKIFGAGGLSGLVAYGSGVIVSPEGHILTVFSHVLDSDVAAVVLHDGRRFAAKTLAADSNLDVALLKIDAVDLPCFPLNDAPLLGPGARVFALSNMFKVATGDEAVSVQRGVVSARSTLSARRGAFSANYKGEILVVDLITNNPGAAGGALVARDGRFVGLLGKELRNMNTETWLNYAIPARVLAPAVDRLISGRGSAASDDPLNSTSLPVAREPQSFGVILVPDVVPKTPAYIDRVLPNSPAAAAGLQPDDLVLFIDDELVPSVRALRASLSRQTGATVRWVVRRGESLVAVKLVLPEKAPSE